MTNTNITIIGNLTGDPELRFTKTGISVANVTIASTPRVYNKQKGEYEDGETLFLKGTVWKELAEHVNESLSRGTRVIATGKLTQRSYEVDGNKRSAYELDIEEIGVSLRYGTASFTKAGRTQESRAVSDPWGNNAPQPSF